MKNAGHLPAQFTRVSWASVVVQLAEQIAVVTLPLAAVLLLGVDATETALLQLAQTLPFLLLALPLGALLDRTSPRPVLVAAALTRAATFGGIAFLIATDLLTFSALMVLGFIGAIGALGFSVGVPACVPLLVEHNRLLDANRWIELGRSVAFVSGPVIGGAFVALLGADKTFVVATMACLAALALLLKLDVRRATRPAHARVERGATRGIRFVFENPILRPIFVTSMVFNVGWFILQAVFVVYATHRLEFSPTGIGFAMGAYGTGMVLGAFITPVLSKRLTVGSIAALGPVGGLIASILTLVTLGVPNPAFVFAGMFMFGFGPVLWAISTTALRQAVTPANLLGRVSSLVVVSTYGARPIGAGIGAVVAATAGIHWCLVASTVAFLAQCAIVFCSHLPGVQELPAASESYAVR